MAADDDGIEATPTALMGRVQAPQLGIVTANQPSARMAAWQNRRVRNRKASEQEGRCFYCSVPMTAISKKAPPGQPSGTDATLDHLKPIRDGGLNRESNCVAACFSCNNERGDRPWQQFMATKRAARKANRRKTTT